MPRPKGSGNKSELVQLALAGIDAQIQQLQSQIEALEEKRKQLAKSGNLAAASAPAPSGKGRKPAIEDANEEPKKKRFVSPATRKKLKEAAKARWARERGEDAE